MRELAAITRVDQAHLLMLAECGVIEEERALQLLSAIAKLQAEHYLPLWEKEASRGLFLLYEDYLIETEGVATGGILQTARSRNDLSATVLKLKIRAPYSRLLDESLWLGSVLLNRSDNYRDTVMPAYTHGQAAMPSTYGHYLAGVAAALLRDCQGLLAAGEDLQWCPLGAGAVAGTSFPINPARTAKLLGFCQGPVNSVDAVASRDVVLRILSAAAIYGVTLSRVATDFSQWTTAEFDLLRLPDELAGSSSAMPQKKNPFLLEHIQGRAGALVGTFVSAATSMHATPFTNSIAVGTEAVKVFWDALRNATEMSILMRLLVKGATPNQATMSRRASEGFTTATELANCLVRNGSLDFRSAHRIVGEAVLAAVENGSRGFDDAGSEYLKQRGIEVDSSILKPAAVIRKLDWGAGPGPRAAGACLEQLRAQWRSLRERAKAQRALWRRAEISLRDEVERRVGAGAFEAAVPR